jgi:hypothetical protein
VITAATSVTDAVPIVSKSVGAKVIVSACPSTVRTRVSPAESP